MAQRVDAPRVLGARRRPRTPSAPTLAVADGRVVTSDGAGRSAPLDAGTGVTDWTDAASAADCGGHHACNGGLPTAISVHGPGRSRRSCPRALGSVGTPESGHTSLVGQPPIDARTGASHLDLRRLCRTRDGRSPRGVQYDATSGVYVPPSPATSVRRQRQLRHRGRRQLARGRGQPGRHRRRPRTSAWSRPAQHAASDRPRPWTATLSLGGTAPTPSTDLTPRLRHRRRHAAGLRPGHRRGGVERRAARGRLDRRSRGERWRRVRPHRQRHRRPRRGHRRHAVDRQPRDARHDGRRPRVTHGRQRGRLRGLPGRQAARVRRGRSDAVAAARPWCARRCSARRSGARPGRHGPCRPTAACSSVRCTPTATRPSTSSRCRAD